MKYTAVRWVQSSFCDHGQRLQVAYVTSSFSGANGNCVQAGYVKSSASLTNSSCVQASHLAALGGEYVMVRDSKDPDGAKVVLEVAEWEFLLTDVRDGRLPAGASRDLTLGDVDLGDPRHPVWLHFTRAEWEAFAAGVLQREFELEVLRAAAPATAPAEPEAAPEGEGADQGGYYAAPV